MPKQVIIVFWLTLIVLVLVKRNDLNQLRKHVTFFFGALTGFIITSPIACNKNEERYHKLVQNK